MFSGQTFHLSNVVQAFENDGIYSQSSLEFALVLAFAPEL